MASGDNDFFKFRDLVNEVVLMAKRSRHAAVLVFEGANRSALGTLVHAHIKSALLENLLQTFGNVFPIFIKGGHGLGLTAESRIRVIHRDYCIAADLLSSAITLVHGGGIEGIVGHGSMRRRLIEDEKSNFSWVRFFENRDRIVLDLREKLVPVPICISVRSRVGNLTRLTRDIPVLVAHAESTRGFANEVRVVY